MHKYTRTILSTAILSLTSLSASANKWEEMNYGPFLSATYLNKDGKSALDGKGCATNKGIAIKLDKEGTSTMLFDTDLLRMSGGWTGGFVNLKGVVFDGSHGPNPGPASSANMVFQVNPGPGWSKGDDLNDPRKLPTGPGAAKVPFGPLPSDWAKYKGLFLNGDKVVLSYTVGSAGVLEMPSSQKAGEDTLLTRTINVVSKGSAPAHLVVADGVEAPNSDSIDSNTPIGVKDNPENADSRLMIAVVGAPKGSTWMVRDGRVLLKLPAFAGGEAFKVIYSKGNAADGAKFQTAVQGSGPIAKLAELTKGGEPLWPEVVTTKGQLGKADGKQPYVVDNIEPPFENPYKAWIRFAGHDFLKNGDAALCTWSGDVWLASGLDDKLEAVKWRRFATGLHQALGLKVVDDKIYVLGRDQITRLHDLNKDGEADLYENFNNDVQVTPGFHEFALDLHTDPQGNFYYAKGRTGKSRRRRLGSAERSQRHDYQSVERRAKAGSLCDRRARPERHWRRSQMAKSPAATTRAHGCQPCYVHLVKKQGEFVGVTDLAHQPETPKDYARHVAFLPMDVDNSGGAQVWVTSKKWGPFEGKLFHLSYGQTTLHQMLTETVDGQVQGGAVQFPVKFETGAMRARFSDHDGQLYVSGLRGWQTKGSKDAGSTASATRVSR
jgi:hypothetical protein